MKGADLETYPNTSALQDMMTDALVHAGTPWMLFKSIVKSGPDTTPKEQSAKEIS
jgi:hypothetical protein